MWRISQGFADASGPKERALAIAQAEAALRLTTEDPMVLAQVATVFACLAHRGPTTVALVGRAVTHAPNSAPVRASAGWTYLYDGRPEEAIAQFAEALRLDPASPHVGNAMAGICFAHLAGGRLEAAVDWGRRAVAASPDLATAHRAHVAALGAAGLPAADALDRLLALDPTFHLTDHARLRGGHVGRPPFAVANEGLRRAGVPVEPSGTLGADDDSRGRPYGRAGNGREVAPWQAPGERS
jgi:tetratricopeptide (TPR) repeat protein